MLSNRVLSLVIAALAIAGGAGAQVDVPLRNWTIPPFRVSSASQGWAPMTDISNGIGFIAVTPCRIADTRGLGFTGQAGPPALNTGTRTFQITGVVAGAPAQCGIPAGANAVSFQFTIVTPNSSGNLIAWPAGGAVPTVSVLNWDAGDTALGNGTIVPVSAAGALSVRINAAIGGATGHLVIDVNGYFTATYPDNNLFVATSTTGGAALLAQNMSTVANAQALRAVITSTTPGDFATAVRAINSGDGYGVWATSATGFGVVAGGGAGGVWSQTNSAVPGVSGVYGSAGLSTGERTYGVRGETESTSLEAAGVFGKGWGGIPGGPLGNAGVRGESAGGLGVVGVVSDLGAAAGVAGVIAGASVQGFLGLASGSNFGVYSIGNAHVQGTITAGGGLKSFVQPHPTDATKEIRYVSLEGPHSEIYFRGTAQVSQGITRIPVPDYFRMVAAPGSYSTLVTPVGDMATVAVVSEGADGVVVRASRNVRIHYVVYAEREAIRQESPIVENTHFRPDPDRDFLAHLPESYRRLMISNGTLHPDGTTNLETARRLGWDKEWDKRKTLAPQPAD